MLSDAVARRSGHRGRALDQLQLPSHQAPAARCTCVWAARGGLGLALRGDDLRQSRDPTRAHCHQYADGAYAKARRRAALASLASALSNLPESSSAVRRRDYQRREPQPQHHRLDTSTGIFEGKLSVESGG
jgi:hypothetical protein